MSGPWLANENSSVSTLFSGVKMKEYSGAVAYIDMLGIGELTRGRVELVENDYHSLDINTKRLFA